MKLAMELPTAYLAEYSPLCDIDFALAQEVLEDKAYAAFYKKQSAAGRYVILDNGFHELGHPLDLKSLAEAAELIDPSVVIAPDWLGEPEKTLKSFETTLTAFKPKWPVGCVLGGKTQEERQYFFNAVYSRTALLCLPFKEPRLDWFRDLADTFYSYRWPRIHLLGVNELQELADFRQTFLANGVNHDYFVSVDTGKPMKWAIQGTRLTLSKSLRGSTTTRLAKQDKLTPTQKADFLYNTAFLRKYV